MDSLNFTISNEYGIKNVHLGYHPTTTLAHGVVVVLPSTWKLTPTINFTNKDKKRMNVHSEEKKG
jgi:hydroxylamine reductase (hybrid-cluster protein)